MRRLFIRWQILRKDFFRNILRNFVRDRNNAVGSFHRRGLISRSKNMQVMRFGNTILRIVFEERGAACKNARKEYEKDNNTNHFNWINIPKKGNTN